MSLSSCGHRSTTDLTGRHCRGLAEHFEPWHWPQPRGTWRKTRCGRRQCSARRQVLLLRAIAQDLGTRPPGVSLLMACGKACAKKRRTRRRCYYSQIPQILGNVSMRPLATAHSITLTVLLSYLGKPQREHCFGDR